MMNRIITRQAGRYIWAILCLLNLAAVLPLSAQPAEWRFNAADYEFSMTMTVAVHYNAAFSSNPADYIAAFHGTELRGVARLQQIPSVDRGLAFLLVKSNRVAGDTITFRIFSAAGGQILPAFNRVVFSSNAIFGNPTAPYLLADSGNPLDIRFSAASILERQPAGTSMGTFSTEDVLGTSHTYDLVSGPGSDENYLFNIRENMLISNAPLDRQQIPQVRLRVRSRNNLGLSIERALVLPVQSAAGNFQVQLTPATIAEGQPVGTLIGMLSVPGQPAEKRFSFQLVPGEGSQDNGSFRIEGARLLSNELFRFAQKNSYTLRVRATDEQGVSQEQRLEVTILRSGSRFNVLLSAEQVEENVPSGAEVGVLSVSDASQNNGVVYRLSGADAASFAIAANRLLISERPDFERKSRYEIVVEAATLPGVTERQAFAIRVTDLNEAPSDLQLMPAAVDENRQPGAIVGFVTAIDQDANDSQVFSLVPGFADNGSFLLRGTELLTNAVFDFERKNSYSLRIRTTDRGGLSFEKTIVVSVNDVNEAPSLPETELEVEENSPNGTLIGRVAATDPDAGQSAQLRYTVVRRPGETRQSTPFAIGETNGELTVNNQDALDFERSPVMLVEVQVSDPGGLTASGVVTVVVKDIFEFDGGSLPVNNIVTPNGDRKNDTFEIRGLSSFDGFRLTIFNATGRVIFESDDYQNNWDGTYEGSPLPTGVFYYLFENPATGVRYKGAVSLVR